MAASAVLAMAAAADLAMAAAVDLEMAPAGLVGQESVQRCTMCQRCKRHTALEQAHKKACTLEERWQAQSSNRLTLPSADAADRYRFRRRS